MALNKKKPILADKINNLINAAPTNIISDDENEETKAKVVEHYEESDDDSNNAIKQSQIRKQNVQFLDELDKRYEGKKVSRKDIYENHESNSEDEEPEDDESTDEMNNDDEDEDLSDEDKEEELTEGSDDKDDDDDDGDEDDYEEEEEEEEGLDKDNPLYRERDDDSNFKTMSAINVNQEMEKGQCIKNQLRIWESLLEMRIKLQQCLAESNQMPQYDAQKNYRRDVDFMKKTNETKSKLTLLLDNMLNLQSTLWKQFPETKSLNRNKNEDEGEQEDDDNGDEEIPSDTEDEEAEENDENVDSSNESNTKENNTLKRKSKFTDYEKILNKRHKSYVNYRNSVINKWDEKTRMVTSQSKKGTTSHTTIERIDFALSDKVKLLKMTQLKRSEYDIIGKSVPTSNGEDKLVEEYDTEIYDDDDFYGQLLKDLIECKSSDIEPEQLRKYRIDLMEKKERERRKMKKDRKVDTRASKGRKVRYNVHNKLVNYMAPITVYDTWTDLSKNELYNSLFGKIKPVETIQH
ncbi:PREDICTED: protein AATF-like [Polistes dominula]|uniref:Protein AATF-like n=1 Tax=Polistes dominula TaxID=743375 RepID=A0ABM1J2X6_POLDO|nr:PREDICTED: protein AATF-like [Polistes dominula]